MNKPTIQWVILTFLLSISLTWAQNPVQTAKTYTQTKNHIQRVIVYIGKSAENVSHN